MVSAKQVVYVYNGHQDLANLILDLDGEIPEPEQGEMITRAGRTWTVAAVAWKQGSGDPPPVPVMQIYLSSEL
jgi:hypothetical protein